MEKVKILWCLMNETVIKPTKKNEDVGFDIYANFTEDEIVIRSGEIVLIPTGLKSVIPLDKAVILKERGSTGTKGLSQRCGVIDSGFRGEWKVPINNTSNKTIIITKDESKVSDYNTTVYPYKKAICQGIIVNNFELDEEDDVIDEDTLNSYNSERGEGMLGNSGK